MVITEKRKRWFKASKIFYQVEALNKEEYNRNKNDYKRQVRCGNNHEDSTPDQSSGFVSPVVHRQRELKIDDEDVLTETVDNTARWRAFEE